MSDAITRKNLAYLMERDYRDYNVIGQSYMLPPPPAFGAGGGHTRWLERGWGVNSSEDARHSSVLYIRKYFVGCSHPLIWEEKGRLVLSIS